MKKMQCPVAKILSLFFSLFFLASIPASSQISNYRLQQADSLFNAKQYTQSLQHYEKIFQQNQYSPAMLMKMAFIEEGLNRIGQAMYYLNLYHIKTADDTALEKMSQLSEKFKLQGYESSDAEIARSFYRQYDDYIAITLGVIMLFLLSLMIYQRRRNRKPIALYVTMIFFAIILFGHINLSSGSERAIIASGNTYVMEGPSGAAPVVEVVAPGHRVAIISRNDVWVQIQWKDRRAFIKQNRLLPILL